MNLFTKKGVVEALVIVYVLCAAIAGLFCYRFFPLFGNAAAKTDKAHTITTEQTPVFVYKDEKGNDHYALATKTLDTTSSLVEQPQQSFWQKLMGLGGFAIVLLVIGCLCPLTAPILIPWLLNAWAKIKQDLQNAQSTATAWQNQHSTLQSSTIDIVQAIDDGFGAFAAQVAVYTGLMNATTDPVQKSNYQAIVSALQTTQAAMLAKIESEMDAANYAKFIAMQKAQATVPAGTTVVAPIVVPAPVVATPVL